MGNQTMQLCKFALPYAQLHTHTRLDTYKNSEWSPNKKKIKLKPFTNKDMYIKHL